MILEHKPMTSTAGSRRNEVKESPSINPDRPVLAVAPLNSVPYIGPQMPSSNNDPRLPTESKSSTKEAEPVERNGPAMIFLPSSTTKEEWNNVMETTKVGVALTGSAAMGKIGPTIGLVDIGESEDSYLFRVSLPGVSREEKDFSCNIDSEGKIIINGVTTTGEKLVCKHSQIFHMQTQNLCPPGRFSISIQLPGPVDPQQISGSFGIDGILEGTVKKKVYYE